MPKMPKMTIVRRVGILGQLGPGLVIFERPAVAGEQAGISYSPCRDGLSLATPSGVWR